MKKILFIILLLLIPSIIFADGKFYSENVPINLPYQRALIVFNGSTEVLLIQNKYKTESKNKIKEFGWIIPVPDIPQLASMNPEDAYSLFEYLYNITEPSIIHFQYFIGLFLFITAFVILLSITKKFENSILSIIGTVCSIGLLLYISFLIIQSIITDSFIYPILPYFLLLFILSVIFILVLPIFYDNRILTISSKIIKIISIILLILLSIIIPLIRGPKSADGVNILKDENVGIYNIKVITSRNSIDLTNWLTHNEFKYNKSDIILFDNYIKNNWFFVVAKVIPANVDNDNFLYNDLTAPIILNFRTNLAIYPLSLSSSIGSDIDILIYLLSNKYMTCNNRLELLFSGIVDDELLNKYSSLINKPHFINNMKMNKYYITKYSNVLEPSEMINDLVFTYSSHYKEYRRTEFGF